MDRIKVIYIVGAGRSGSTVLDTVLGGSTDVENVGELINAPGAFYAADEYCACGGRVGDCSFWCSVHQEWVAVSEFDDFHELDRLQRRYELKKSLPYLLISRLLKTPRYRRYLEAEQAMYHAIAHVSGKRIIIDSSKNPLRAFALSKMPEIDFYAIHLIRDGRGVTWSLSKPLKKDSAVGVQKDLRSKPVWRTALFWLVTNLLTEIFVRQVLTKKFLRIRYEDFVENTGATLKDIGKFIGVDYRGVSEKISNGEKLSVGHTVAGNRVRMTGMIRLEPDYSWKKLLPKKDKAIFWSIAGLLAGRYGYRRNPVK